MMAEDPGCKGGEEFFSRFVVLTNQILIFLLFSRIDLTNRSYLTNHVLTNYEFKFF